MFRFVAVFFVSFIALGQQPIPPPVKIPVTGRAEIRKSNNEQRDLKQSPGKTPIPSPVTIQPRQPTSQAQATESENKTNKTNDAISEQRVSLWRSRIDRAFDPSTWSNWALFLAAAIAAVIALRTLSAIQQQARIARIGLGATRVAANAARKSADVAELALKVVERADLLLEAVGIVNTEQRVDDSGYGNQIIIKFKNMGRTRANTAIFRSFLEIPGVPTKEKTLGPVVVGPGATQKLNCGMFGDFLNAETAEGVLNGTIPMKFTVRATFTDVFGDAHTTEHRGTFRSKTRSFFIDPPNAEPDAEEKKENAD